MLHKSRTTETELDTLVMKMIEDIKRANPNTHTPVDATIDRSQRANMSAPLLTEAVAPVDRKDCNAA